jgi:NitT/TauT family transport system ATP-binding protein
MSSFLSVKNIAKSYASSPSGGLQALQQVSFDVAEGEFVAILGPSGCGKSTLLQIIAGLVPATSGEILLSGKRITAPPRDMVYLFQQYNKSLFAWRTVGKNVAFPLENRGLKQAEIRERSLDYLRIVGLGGFENHYPWQLSGGMQQRVAIARALAAQPSVLLMDEPFSAVDALTRLELQSLVLDIWSKQRLTVLLVTHDVDEAVFLADRVAMLTSRPLTIGFIAEMDLARPRDAITTREDPRFLTMRHRLVETLLKRPAAEVVQEAAHA